jgi:hypothetical protein
VPIVHSREEMEAVVTRLSERAFADGVLWDIPKARRREQAKNPMKQLRIGLDGDLKIRMATQIERYLAHYGNKGVAWDAICKRLEGPFEDEA